MLSQEKWFMKCPSRIQNENKTHLMCSRVTVEFWEMAAIYRLMDAQPLGTGWAVGQGS